MRERPEVHEIFARWQAIAREYDPKPTLMGETYVSLSKLPGYDGTSISSRTSRSSRQVRGRQAEADRRDDGAHAPLAAVVRLEPRPLAARDPLGGRRRAQGARRALPAADPARDRGPLPGRRDRARRRRRRREARARPGGAAARSGAHAAPVDGVRCRVARAVAAALRHDAQHRGPAPDPTSTLHYVRDLIARRKEFADAPYRTLPSANGVWAYARSASRASLNMTPDTAVHEGRTLAPWETAIL